MTEKKCLIVPAPCSAAERDHALLATYGVSHHEYLYVVHREVLGVVGTFTKFLNMSTTPVGTAWVRWT